MLVFGYVCVRVCMMVGNGGGVVYYNVGATLLNSCICICITFLLKERNKTKLKCDVRSTK